jgi:hypothetical protein
MYVNFEAEPDEDLHLVQSAGYAHVMLKIHLLRIGPDK